jgi:hypothetical protein
LHSLLLDIRKNNPGLAHNEEISFIDAPEGVVAFERGSGILIYCNTNNKECKVNLDSLPGLNNLPAEGYVKLIATNNDCGMSGHELLLAPNSTIWLQKKQ